MLEGTYKVKHDKLPKGAEKELAKYTAVSAPLAEHEFAPVNLNFGDGWLMKSAQDLCKIAIAFGGFDAGEIVLAITKVQKKREGKANLATVEKALQMVYEAHETPEDKARREAAYKALMEKIRG